MTEKYVFTGSARGLSRGGGTAVFAQQHGPACARRVRDQLPLEVTPHPEPQTLNPQPSTLNPKPSTLNPQPSPLTPQLSTLNPSTLPQALLHSSRPHALSLPLPGGRRFTISGWGFRGAGKGQFRPLREPPRFGRAFEPFRRERRFRFTKSERRRLYSRDHVRRGPDHRRRGGPVGTSVPRRAYQS